MGKNIIILFSAIRDILKKEKNYKYREQKREAINNLLLYLNMELFIPLPCSEAEDVLETLASNGLVKKEGLGYRYKDPDIYEEIILFIESHSNQGNVVFGFEDENYFKNPVSIT